MFVGTTPNSKGYDVTDSDSGELAAVDAAVRNAESELLALTHTLISIDSQIPPHGDERAIATFLQEEIVRRGLPPATVHAKRDDRPNLVVRIPGARPDAGKNLLLNAHMDTKPVGEAAHLWRTDPFQPTVIDGNIFGLGSNDMKAAIAAMLVALSAVRSTGRELDGDILLALVADEEAGATYGSKFLAERLQGVDACLIGEPSGWTHDWQGIHLVSRGVSGFRIVVTGTQKHSSLSDRIPTVNASVKLAGLMDRMSEEVRFTHTPHSLGDVGPTLNVGVLLSGGTFFGVTPGRAECACDLRTVPGMSLDSVRADLERWLGECRARDKDLKVDLRFEPGLEWVPPSEIPAKHRLVDVVRHSAAAVLGAPPPLTVFPGATDAPWFDTEGIPTIASFGPGILASAHGPNEFVSQRSVTEAARMYARIMVEFAGSGAQ